MSTQPTGHDMSRFWRLVSVDGGPVQGTFWVDKPDEKRDEQIIKAVDVTIWHDERHTHGRIVSDMTAFVRSGAVEIPPHMIRESVRDDVLDNIDGVSAAVLAASAAVTWPEEDA